jgi:histidyl-tRNA synthetase
VIKQNLGYAQSIFIKKIKMKEIKETCYKGTRILLGNKKRNVINKMIQVLTEEGFEEISIPIIQLQDIFSDKVGEENNNMMYNFKDRGDRNLCLAPEYTAVIQKLAKTTFKMEKDVKVFYIQECFRGEKPQAGRYRQFTQLGVEILNPSGYLTDDYMKYIIEIAEKLLYQNLYGKSLREVMELFNVNREVTRGLDYYTEGKGFEITCDTLGSSKQICGGGSYDGGLGFAIGIDRILNIMK